MDNIKQKIFSGVLWNTLEVIINKSLSLLIQLILARLLFPKDYGIVGMATVFVSIIEVVNDLGFGAAIIQKKQEQLNKEHKNTAFWVGVFWSLFIYLVVYFFISKCVADFYKLEILETVVNVLCISLLVSPINMIHRAQLMRDLKFKQIAYVNSISNLLSGSVSIFLAYHGYGIWSLVFYNVLKYLVQLPLFFYFSKWIPQLYISKKAFSEIFGFGMYTLGTSLFNKVSVQIDYLLVGKFVGQTALGNYTFAFLLTNILRNQIVSILNNVLYPVYAKLQDNYKELLSLYFEVLRLNNLLVYPFITVLLFYSESIIPYFWGSKWNDSIVLVRLFCIGVYFQMMNNSHTSVLRAIGRVELELKLQMFKSVVFYVPLIVLGLKLDSVRGAAIGYVIATFISMLLSNYVMQRIFKYGFRLHMLKLRLSLIYLLLSFCCYFIQKQTSLPVICQILLFILYTCFFYYLFCKETIVKLLNFIRR